MGKSSENLAAQLSPNCLSMGLLWQDNRRTGERSPTSLSIFLGALENGGRLIKIQFCWQKILGKNGQGRWGPGVALLFESNSWSSAMNPPETLKPEGHFLPWSSYLQAVHANADGGRRSPAKSAVSGHGAYGVACPLQQLQVHLSLNNIFWNDLAQSQQDKKRGSHSFVSCRRMSGWCISSSLNLPSDGLQRVRNCSS